MVRPYHDRYRERDADLGRGAAIRPRKIDRPGVLSFLIDKTRDRYSLGQTEKDDYYEETIFSISAKKRKGRSIYSVNIFFAGRAHAHFFAHSRACTLNKYRVSTICVIIISINYK